MCRFLTVNWRERSWWAGLLLVVLQVQFSLTLTMLLDHESTLRCPLSSSHVHSTSSHLTSFEAFRHAHRLDLDLRALIVVFGIRAAIKNWIVACRQARQCD